MHSRDEDIRLINDDTGSMETAGKVQQMKRLLNFLKRLAGKFAGVAGVAIDWQQRIGTKRMINWVIEAEKLVKLGPEAKKNFVATLINRYVERTFGIQLPPAAVNWLVENAFQLYLAARGRSH